MLLDKPSGFPSIEVTIHCMPYGMYKRSNGLIIPLQSDIHVVIFHYNSALTLLTTGLWSTFTSPHNLTTSTQRDTPAQWTTSQTEWQFIISPHSLPPIVPSFPSFVSLAAPAMFCRLTYKHIKSYHHFRIGTFALILDIKYFNIKYMHWKLKKSLKRREDFNCIFIQCYKFL